MDHATIDQGQCDGPLPIIEYQGPNVERITSGIHDHGMKRTAQMERPHRRGDVDDRSAGAEGRLRSLVRQGRRWRLCRA